MQCSSCGFEIPPGAKFCPGCAKPVQSVDTHKSYPAYLWAFPILFGIIGGIVAAIVAGAVYKSRWWNLLIVGLCMSFIWAAIYYALGFNTASIMK